MRPARETHPLARVRGRVRRRLRAALRHWAAGLVARALLRAALLGIALAGASGCVVVGRSVTGSIPAPAAIRALVPGQPLGEVLARCGAPLEAWRQPDGLLLVYDRHAYDYERIGLDPSRALAFVELTQTATSALSNLRLVIERGERRDARLVLLFDEEDRLLAVAYRGPAGERAP